ncbi:nitroreductase family protein [Mobiluncus holmesii ATCC 35242]|uniref:Nitroreductase family protein n=1 Tax=Mobiluncus holmesii ATCC 35242 TaxID=887899 RepID=E6M474_9ACTO|nr:nitroreductase [Mobiluncus holmesii]EFU81841.1 nitroreductase family protein [Mobiluncus holmesii ATCC 35242]STY88311.1 nitroreductase A [Mobiluncus holmesii]
MDFSELLQARYSVRAYLDKPVEPEVLQAVLDDARHCASWSNTRGYVLAVATGERLERIRADYASHAETGSGMLRGRLCAYLRALWEGKLPQADFKTWGKYPPELRQRQVANGKRYYTHLGIERGDETGRVQQLRQNLEMFQAPVGIFVFVHRALLPFSAQDTGLMLSTLMLAAANRGLGTVAIGTLATWRKPVDKEFHIPKDYGLITGLAMGYPDPDAPVNAYRAEHPPLTLAEPRHV